MSNQGHSKDPGKSHERSESSKDDKHASPTKWRNSTTPGSASSSPTHAGPSPKSHSNAISVAAGKTANNIKKILQTLAKEEQAPQVQLPSELVVPVKRIAPPEQLGLERLNLDGAADIPLLHGIPNGVFHNSNDGCTSDNSGTENYSDHESGSSTAGCQDSGRNSNQSPSDLCATQTHISILPENALENIFSFIELSDIRNTSMVCHAWNRVIGDENNEVWRTQCFKRMSRDVVYSELLSTCPTFKAKLRAHIHAWNPLDCSRNIYVKPNGFTIHRNPVAQSTDGARGRIGFNKGRHAWEVVWEGPLGTVAVVGVATQQAEVRAQGYIALLGKDDQSWGWNLVENLLLHNGDSQGNYPVINNAPRYQVGERIRVILDCEDNTLSFEKNFEFLGVAFRGLPNREKLYPAVSAVYGNTEISMVYLGPPLDG